MENKKKSLKKETKKSEKMLKREKILHIINSAVLLAVFAGIALFMTFGERPNVSYTENRDLEKPPEFTWEGYFSGYVTDQFSKYYNDTVPMRSTWKLFISNFRSHIGIKYNGGVTIVGPLPVIDNPSKPDSTSSRPANSIPAVVIPGGNSGANNSNKVPAVVLPGGNSSANGTADTSDTENSLPYSKVPAVVIPNTANDGNTTAE